ncbi:MAG: hypothetical protein LBO81_01040 [Clostridiales Family XIII bacterium]|nr:hypothetical protein [Clostridiales Family XIII bacterium]
MCEKETETSTVSPGLAATVPTAILKSDIPVAAKTGADSNTATANRKHKSLDLKLRTFLPRPDILQRSFLHTVCNIFSEVLHTTRNVETEAKKSARKRAMRPQKLFMDLKPVENATKRKPG